MKVKVFDKNEKGKIEFTRKELEALLNEVFDDGYQEGKDNRPYTWTSPSITYKTYSTDPYCTTTSNTEYINYATGVGESSILSNMIESICYGDIQCDGQMELDLR